jgi:hypothetical protein
MNNFASVPTSKPSERWVNMTPTERVDRCRIRSLKFAEIHIIEARPDGQVIVALNKPFSASERGTLLLDLEEP